MHVERVRAVRIRGNGKVQRADPVFVPLQRQLAYKRAVFCTRVQKDTAVGHRDRHQRAWCAGDMRQRNVEGVLAVQVQDLARFRECIVAGQSPYFERIVSAPRNEHLAIVRQRRWITHDAQRGDRGGVRVRHGARALPRPLRPGVVRPPHT